MKSNKGSRISSLLIGLFWGNSLTTHDIRISWKTTPDLRVMKSDVSRKSEAGIPTPIGERSWE